MKFVISRLELNDLINRVQGIVGSRSTLPILSHVLLQATQDEITLTTTDLTVGIKARAETNVLEEGTTTLPIKHLAQLVRELTSINLEVTSRQDLTEIVADASRFKLHGVNPSEFPSLPQLEGATRFTIRQPTLKDAFFRTSFAVSQEDNRFVLTGVLMQIANGVATFVAADGMRLARTHTSIDLPREFSGMYSIPLKAVAEITRNLTEDPEDLATIYLLPDRIAVEANHVTVVSKLLQGEFPDYNQVIPNTCEKVLRVPREELISLLRQIGLFATQDSPSVRFTFSQGELQLVKNSSDLGEGLVSMPTEYTGEKLEIAFNPHALLDILRHCSHESITVGLSDAFNPGVITEHTDAATNTQPSPLFVLMPMRLAEV